TSSSRHCQTLTRRGNGDRRTTRDVPEPGRSRRACAERCRGHGRGDSGVARRAHTEPSRRGEVPVRGLQRAPDPHGRQALAREDVVISMSGNQTTYEEATRCPKCGNPGEVAKKEP